MRGSLARSVRKLAYGNYSLKLKRKYIQGFDGSVRAVGLRAKYQRLKAETKRVGRGEL